MTSAIVIIVIPVMLGCYRCGVGLGKKRMKKEYSEMLHRTHCSIAYLGIRCHVPDSDMNCSFGDIHFYEWLSETELCDQSYFYNCNVGCLISLLYPHTNNTNLVIPVTYFKRLISHS
jgi:hypothetical protein